MSEPKKIKTKQEQLQEKVILFGGIAFVVLSIIAVATTDEKGSRSKEVDVSVFSEEHSSKKTGTSKQNKYVQPDIMTEIDVKDSNLIVGVQPQRNKAASVVEDAIGKTSDELKAEFAIAQTKEVQSPYKVIETLTIPDEPLIGNKKTTKAVSSDCITPAKAVAKSLLEDGEELRSPDSRTKWKSVNDTDFYIAITVMQDRKDVGLIVMPPDSTLENTVPATHLEFVVKKGKRDCIDLSAKGGLKTKLPLVTKRVDGKSKENQEYYEKTTFETAITIVKDRLAVKTVANE